MSRYRFVGSVSPTGMAEDLVEYFNRQPRMGGEQLGQGDHVVVRIGRRRRRERGIRGAVYVQVDRTPDGIVVAMDDDKSAPPASVREMSLPEVLNTAINAILGLPSPHLTMYQLFRGARMAEIRPQAMVAVRLYCRQRNAVEAQDEVV